MAHADEVGGKIGGYLREALPQLPLSRDLATIRDALELEVAPAELTVTPGDEAALRAFLERYEFSSWLQELGTPEQAPAPADYEVILTQEQLDRWLAALAAAELIAVDTETTALDPMQAELVGLSFALEAGRAAYLPLAHDYPGAPPQLARDTVLEQLRPLLEDPQQALVGQHFEYDMNVLSRYGIQCQGVRYDTMLESYVFNATGTRHDMDSLALKYLGRQTVHYEDIAGKGKKQLTFK